MDKLTVSRSEEVRIPSHVAIIMDGNGRWAREQNQDRFFGHIRGVETVRVVLKEAILLGIKTLTLYTFSEENWQRPQQEVDALMTLLPKVINDELDELIKEGVRIDVIGELDRLPEISRKALLEAIEQTKENSRFRLILAINYSGRSEIIRAANRLLGEKGPITEQRFREELFSDAPDPDLLIRTGGEQRISNFLLWQMAYTELYFTPVYWPAFGAEEFRKAIQDYQCRQRRFGMTGEQIDALEN